MAESSRWVITIKNFEDMIFHIKHVTCRWTSMCYNLWLFKIYLLNLKAAQLTWYSNTLVTTANIWKTKCSCVLVYVNVGFLEFLYKTRYETLYTVPPPSIDLSNAIVSVFVCTIFTLNQSVWLWYVHKLNKANRMCCKHMHTVCMPG